MKHRDARLRFASLLALAFGLVIASSLPARSQATQGAWLGVAVRNEGSGLTAHVVVVDVVQSGPGAQAGLRAGDIIFSIQGQGVRTTDDVGRIVRSVPAGSRLALTIMRGQQQTSLTVISRQAPAQEAPGSDVAAFIEAARRGQTDMVKRLLEKGVNIEAKDNDGWTALMRAAREDLGSRTDMVKFLLGKGANIEAKNNDGWTALIAATAGSPKQYMVRAGTVKLLLEAGANIEATDNRGNTALMHAANNGECALTGKLGECEYRTVKLLLEKGANIDAKNHRGNTALMVANASGFDGIAELLSAKSAKPARLVEPAKPTAGTGVWRGRPTFDPEGRGGVPMVRLKAPVGLLFSASATADCRGGDWLGQPTIETGALPPGLGLSRGPTKIEGVPTRPGTWYFSVRFSNLTCSGTPSNDVIENVEIVTEGSAAPARAQ